MKELTRHAIGVPAEYVLKAAVPTTGVLAAGAEGGVLEKTVRAYASIPQAIASVMDVPERASELANLLNDYNTQTAREFTAKYGGEGVQVVADALNGAIEYTTHVAQNLSDQPIETIAAVGLAAGITYLGSRGARFWRQRGQGSFLDKKERNLGRKVFRA